MCGYVKAHQCKWDRATPISASPKNGTLACSTLGNAIILTSGNKWHMICSYIASDGTGVEIVLTSE